jgi:hypothetical protein
VNSRRKFCNRSERESEASRLRLTRFSLTGERLGWDHGSADSQNYKVSNYVMPFAAYWLGPQITKPSGLVKIPSRRSPTAPQSHRWTPMDSDAADWPTSSGCPLKGHQVPTRAPVPTGQQQAGVGQPGSHPQDSRTNAAAPHTKGQTRHKRAACAQRVVVTPGVVAEEESSLKQKAVATQKRSGPGKKSLPWSRPESFVDLTERSRCATWRS